MGQGSYFFNQAILTFGLLWCRIEGEFCIFWHPISIWHLILHSRSSAGVIMSLFNYSYGCDPGPIAAPPSSLLYWVSA